MLWRQPDQTRRQQTYGAKIEKLMDLNKFRTFATHFYICSWLHSWNPLLAYENYGTCNCWSRAPTVNPLAPRQTKRNLLGLSAILGYPGYPIPQKWGPMTEPCSYLWAQCRSMAICEQRSPLGGFGIFAAKDFLPGDEVPLASCCELEVVFWLWKRTTNFDSQHTHCACSNMFEALFWLNTSWAFLSLVLQHPQFGHVFLRLQALHQVFMEEHLARLDPSALVDPSWVTFDWGTPFCSSKTAVLTADNQAKGWIQRKLWMSRISFPWRTNLTCHLPARIRVVEYIFWGCQRAGLSNCVYIRINICTYILYVCQSSLLDAAPATIRWRRQRQAFPRFLLPGTNLMIRSLKLWMLKSGFNFLTVFLRHHDGGCRLVLTLVVLDKSRFAFFCWTQFMRLRFNCS